MILESVIKKEIKMDVRKNNWKSKPKRKYNEDNCIVDYLEGDVVIRVTIMNGTLMSRKGTEKLLATKNKDFKHMMRNYLFKETFMNWNRKYPKVVGKIFTKLNK